jgi:hypothetical protein
VDRGTYELGVYPHQWRVKVRQLVTYLRLLARKDGRRGQVPDNHPLTRWGNTNKREWRLFSILPSSHDWLGLYNNGMAYTYSQTYNFAFTPDRGPKDGVFLDSIDVMALVVSYLSASSLTSTYLGLKH